MGLIIGSLFFDLDEGTDADVVNHLSLLYMVLIFLGLANLGAISVLVYERSVFLREKAAGAVGTFAYWFSMGVHLLFPVPAFSVYLAMIYSMARLNWNWGKG